MNYEIQPCRGQHTRRVMKRWYGGRFRVRSVGNKFRSSERLSLLMTVMLPALWIVTLSEWGRERSALANKTDTFRVDRLKRRDNGARYQFVDYDQQWVSSTCQVN